MIFNKSLENLPGEIWKDIKDFEGCYQVSNKGRVKSLARISPNKHFIKEKILTPTLSLGYLRIFLSKNGKPKSSQMQKLVALAFIPNPLNLPEVNHKDLNKLNNNVENLEWITHPDNIQHALKNGAFNNMLKGKEHGMAKLIDENVIEIRKMWQSNNFYRYEIAKKFDIDGSTVTRIVNGELWKHVK